MPACVIRGGGDPPGWGCGSSSWGIIQAAVFASMRCLNAVDFLVRRFNRVAGRWRPLPEREGAPRCRTLAVREASADSTGGTPRPETPRLTRLPRASSSTITEARRRPGANGAKRRRSSHCAPESSSDPQSCSPCAKCPRTLSTGSRACRTAPSRSAAWPRPADHSQRRCRYASRNHRAWPHRRQTRTPSCCRRGRRYLPLGFARQPDRLLGGDELRRAHQLGRLGAKSLGFREGKHLDRVAIPLPATGILTHHRFPQILRNLVLGDGEVVLERHFMRRPFRGAPFGSTPDKPRGKHSLPRRDLDKLTAKRLEQRELLRRRIGGQKRQ